MKVLQQFRSLVDAIELVAFRLGAIADRMDEAGPATERLEALETSRVRHEAEVEGILLKAQGKLKAASNAEARARTMLKHYEENFDEGDSNSPDIQDRVPYVDVGTGPEEGMPPLRLDLEEDDRSRLLRAKWGDS